MADKFVLRVKAGPAYDEATHQVVQVNSPKPLHITTPSGDVLLNIRIQNFRGLPSNSPKTSTYFDHASHTRDQYSISFALLPKTAVSGSDLVFGNDFDRPIRDRLPPGFSAAFRIVKWAIDPGLEGDPYTDKPYLYGPALSSLNVLRVGDARTQAKTAFRGDEAQHDAVVVEEGADGDGVEVREKLGVPSASDARKKWFLDAAKRDAWTWEAGRVYQADFFNPFLDFNEFALKLPGFSLSILSIWNSPEGDNTHTLRYVLKNKSTGDVYFVVTFTVYTREEVEKLDIADKEKQTNERNGVGAGTVATDGKEPASSVANNDDDEVD
ncbi:MAG: hypothetical protein M1825_005213 [Sarcosagium campestre]|nr:MAG: hypothetical protein M1825_005213 [Sarcosagium campestre]